jgi:hypothetical protein
MSGEKGVVAGRSLGRGDLGERAVIYNNSTLCRYILFIGSCADCAQLCRSQWLKGTASPSYTPRVMDMRGAPPSKGDLHRQGYPLFIPKLHSG